MDNHEGSNKNIYQDLKNNPETIKKREEKKQRLNEGIQNVLNRIYKRKPSWRKQDILRMDLECLRNGERCIMWDDTGAGFYMLIRWDWLKNEPAFVDRYEEESNGRSYTTVASILKPPFLDTSLPHHEVAQWIDENTVTIHHRLLPHIHEIRLSENNATYKYELPPDNLYWQELLSQEGH